MQKKPFKNREIYIEMLKKAILKQGNIHRNVKKAILKQGEEHRKAQKTSPLNGLVFTYTIHDD